MEVSIVTFTIVGREQGHTKNINDLQNFMNERGKTFGRDGENVRLFGWRIAQRSSEWLFSCALLLYLSPQLVACSRRSILYIDDTLAGIPTITICGWWKWIVFFYRCLMKAGQFLLFN